MYSVHIPLKRYDHVLLWVSWEGNVMLEIIFCFYLFLHLMGKIQP